MRLPARSTVRDAQVLAQVNPADPDAQVVVLQGAPTHVRDPAREAARQGAVVAVPAVPVARDRVPEDAVVPARVDARVAVQDAVPHAPVSARADVIRDVPDNA